MLWSDAVSSSSFSDSGGDVGPSSMESDRNARQSPDPLSGGDVRDDRSVELLRKDRTLHDPQRS